MSQSKKQEELEKRAKKITKVVVLVVILVVFVCCAMAFKSAQAQESQATQGTICRADFVKGNKIALYTGGSQFSFFQMVKWADNEPISPIQSWHVFAHPTEFGVYKILIAVADGVWINAQLQDTLCWFQYDPSAFGFTPEPDETPIPTLAVTPVPTAASTATPPPFSCGGQVWAESVEDRLVTIAVVLSSVPPQGWTVKAVWESGIQESLPATTERLNISHRYQEYGRKSVHLIANHTSGAWQYCMNGLGLGVDLVPPPVQTPTVVSATPEQRIGEGSVEVLLYEVLLPIVGRP